MEESKRKEIREYIETQVNPIIRPLVEEIVRKRPSNIPGFINEYSFKLMSNSFITQITNKDQESNLNQMKNRKKPKPNFYANWRKRRKRNSRKRTVAKESVQKCLVSSIRRLSSNPT